MADSGERGSASLLSMMDDPFITKPEGARNPIAPNNYSSFDAQLYSLDASLPAQAKRALEAHLAETERRLEEASKLGTALVEQRRELEDKLKEVEQQQEEGQIGPELRRKLADLEREYTEIGRETARAFLAPKRLAGGDDAHLGTPSLDHKSPISSAMFAGQATNSPSKVSVPSRKQRNQPSTRVHDIEFATEISTSLLAQVRQLQSLLAEREDALRTVNLEKSRLELEAEGYAQRIRALDESEERYKDENWALETKTHELMASVKDAADRESKLNSNLGAITAEKSAMERELEDLKQTNAKLIEEHTTAQKANDAEIHLLRRNLNAGDAEKLTLQRKLEEMNTQNQELAKAVAMRLRQHEVESVREVTRGHDPDDQDQATPENSPPPSPSKFTPRHNHLETETLRSSLGHAHRMIQNLRSTVHREKTEKIELKRMLQDARDEIEQRRRDSAAPGGSNKRQKTKTDASRKAARPDLLGAGRKKAEVEIQESDWEDNAGDISPTRQATLNSRIRRGDQSTDERSDTYQTAAETDDPFETANERETATESEAFQTGVESMAGESTDSDELTETEDRVNRTPRERVSSLTLAKARDRTSYYSTASTSADEDDSEDPGTPSASQYSTPRYQLRKKRSVLRKIRPSGEAPMAFGSRPSSARDSPATSFTRESSAAPEGQSLFAELAELDGDEDEDGSFGPPMQSDPTSPSTPRMQLDPDSRTPSEIPVESPSKPPKPAMVDSGVMTDPWEPTAAEIAPVAVTSTDQTDSDVPATPMKVSMTDAATGVGVVEPSTLVNSGTQWTPLKPAADLNGDQVSSVPTPPKMAWDGQTPDDREREVETTASSIKLDVSSISSEETAPVAPTYPELSTSYFVGGAVEPVVASTSVPPEVGLSSISSQSSEPEVPISTPVPVPPEVGLSTVSSQSSEPEELVVSPAPEPEPAYIPELSFSQVFTEQTLPVLPSLPEPKLEPVRSVAEQGTSTDITEFSVSTIFSEETEPVEAVEPSPEPEVVLTPANEAVPEPTLPELTLAFIPPEYTEPVAPEAKEVIIPPVPQLMLSPLSSVETQPVDYTPSVAFLPSPSSFENNPPSETVGSSVPIKDDPHAVVVEKGTDKDSADEIVDRQSGTTLPLGVISGNAAPRRARAGSSYQADQGAQTILSSKQIDQLLIDRVSSRPLSPPESDGAKGLSNSPFATPKARSRPAPQASTTSLPRRPGSAASQASSIQKHPPLPVDHKELIQAAERKSMEQRPTSSGLMGPPLAPASAYRMNATQRPWTPNEAVYSGSAKTTASRASVRRESQMSRRSSVSSFASELDERFNIQPNQTPAPQGYSMGTDPRMIQAITQTMIGEFLWKYTRRAVSGDISNTRHRRYFWVHPYTRTLYWSEQDPQSAGKSEIRTKSVSIEAVRVVADDNPYPPGLHCKSLEVVSPGRRIRFTATTSQRHETWFNALSYLLVRNNPEDGEGENGVTLEDIDEFNPGFRSRSRQAARMSISSQQSRNARTLPKQRSGSAMSLRPSATPGRASPAYPPSHYSDQARQSSASRLSTLLNSTIKSSFGRKGSAYAASSVHEGSLHNHDSDEDLRQMMERHEQDADRLENVRACCDGKHDVSSLSRTSRYSPRANRIHSHH